jgi:hypothetical protein
MVVEAASTKTGEKSSGQHVPIQYSPASKHPTGAQRRWPHHPQLRQPHRPRGAVRFVEANGDTRWRRSYTLSPVEVTNASHRLDRAGYRRDIDVDGGSTGLADCLVGSCPDETTLVAVGTGSRLSRTNIVTAMR